MPEGLSVHEFHQLVNAAITNSFPQEVWIRGVISGISRSANGHVYFDLIDSDSTDSTDSATQTVVPIALFAKSKYRVNAILKRTNAIRMTDGVEVQIRGEVVYYPRQSRVQLIMTLIDPAYTLGQIESAKAKLLIDLKAEGLLNANRRHRLTALPTRIALITSSGSAAEADFVNELETSGFAFEITLFDTRVQGDEAVAGLSAALEEAGRANSTSFDVVAVIRGGGAKTDLAAFDHGDVARGIALSNIPVIVGVGHETDSSVADAVAHTSEKTPTASARVLIDTIRTFEQQVSNCADRIAHRAKDRLNNADQALSNSRSRLARSSLETATRSSGQLDRLSDRARQASQLCLERATAVLDRADVQIKANDPEVALARGWSITRTETGDLARSFDKIEEGTILITTLLGGTITSSVTKRTPKAETLHP